MEEARCYKIHTLIGILLQSRNKYSWKSFRKGRLIYGVTGSVVVCVFKRKTVKSSESHMVSKEFVFPWPGYNVLGFVPCIYCS